MWQAALVQLSQCCCCPHRRYSTVITEGWLPTWHNTVCCSWPEGPEAILTWHTPRIAGSIKKSFPTKPALCACERYTKQKKLTNVLIVEPDSKESITESIFCICLDNAFAKDMTFDELSERCKLVLRRRINYIGVNRGSQRSTKVRMFLKRGKSGRLDLLH